MFGAYVFLASGNWGTPWGVSSIYERLGRMPEPGDKDTRVRIVHGTEDQHVPL
jgi:hypothetical protein